LFAQDTGLIENTEEIVIVEAAQQSEETSKTTPAEPTPRDVFDAIPEISKEEWAVPTKSKALELKETPVTTYTFTPHQYVPNSTSLGSLEFSSKPKWIKPIDSLRIEDAKIDPKSVQSYDAKAKGMTYCSWITRNNLERFTKLQDKDTVKGFDGKWILVGDAITIIEQGLRTNIFKEVYLDDGSIQKYLSRVHRHTKATLFDIYVHHSKMENRFFAGHRVTGFLWTDDQWYILDPVMIPHQDPMLLTEYFKKYGKPDQDRIYILRTWYAPAGYKVEPYPMMAVKYFSELKPLIDREDIIVTTSGAETMVAFNTDIRFLAEYTFIDIAAGTVMTMAWALEDNFSITSADGTSGASSALPWRVLWSAQANIHFSQPAKFTVFSEWENNTPFTPRVLDQHNNIIQSISSNNDVSCNNDWTIATVSTKERRLDDGQASFYSCYGGRFSIIPGIALGVDIESDGIAPFHNESYDGSLYQGQDNTGNNLLVRAGDTIDYRVSIFGSDQVQDDVALDLYALGTLWEKIAYFESIPSDCLSWSYLSWGNEILHCIIDESFVHDNFSFHVTVHIDKEAENKSSVMLRSKTRYQWNTIIEKESPTVLVTNYYDNSTLTKITETVKESGNLFLDSFKWLVGSN
jgi:hypothetical protein